MQKIAIRTCRLAEVDVVLRLWRKADAEPVVGEEAATVRALLRGRSATLLVAVEGTRVVGSLIVGFDGWRGNLYRLAVLPELRRRGLASRLVREGERHLRARGARRISAVVIGSNRGARAFWRAAGYELNAGRVRFVKNFGGRP